MTFGRFFHRRTIEVGGQLRRQVRYFVHNRWGRGSRGRWRLGRSRSRCSCRRARAGLGGVCPRIIGRAFLSRHFVKHGGQVRGCQRRREQDVGANALGQAKVFHRILVVVVAQEIDRTQVDVGPSQHLVREQVRLFGYCHRLQEAVAGRLELLGVDLNQSLLVQVDDLLDRPFILLAQHRRGRRCQDRTH